MFDVLQFFLGVGKKKTSVEYISLSSARIKKRERNNLLYNWLLLELTDKYCFHWRTDSGWFSRTYKFIKIRKKNLTDTDLVSKTIRLSWLHTQVLTTFKIASNYWELWIFNRNLLNYLSSHLIKEKLSFIILSIYYERFDLLPLRV